MVSSSVVAGWMSTLLEAAENVRSSVRKTLISRPGLEITSLKNLLDSEAQRAIHETLEQAGRPVNVISEEGDYSIGEEGPYLIVDPVDGTTNMARGIPFAATSMALSETLRLSDAVAGIVKDLYTGEVYRAERNRGAWRGGRRIAPGRSRQINEALISIDVSKGTPIEGVEPLIRGAEHLRQLGSAALSLCHLASGLIDAHVDVRGKLRATDVAAGLLILREAGGVYVIDGSMEGDLDLSRGSTLKLVAASGSWTLDEILKILS
ncbi:MAG: fructose 1,6-bisphosphatase [Candidatus Bathyarchaeota archaeon]|nr:MAG: fructose 1,6-bisphosphatase [Candidatus Bathyarchaeota archaeon]